MEDEGGRWITFGVLPLRQRLSLYLWVAVPGVSLLVILCVEFVLQVSFRLFGSFGYLILILVAIPLSGIILVVYLASKRAPQVDFEEGKLRVGHRTLALGDIDTASLVVFDKRGRRLMALSLGTMKGPSALVYLLGADGPVLSARDQAILVRLLEQTSIAMPTSPDDPTGRFARYTFPGHLDREAAIEVVRKPPAVGDQLPVSY
ncbi:hypothetical protein [Cryobacterium tepidiphilum]|uniref:PH domain-containing protein n=1 Tax=Cryobacterium tepidiphilum TaxID=2486026 RepID=A0A3M8LM66_9MICO|nr:hypothetical protein [Cryobacterium tepidiphilum]RNE66455.1 hypothetical protein EEJ31_03365 [Cryobacterium tepidiphilum]